MIKYFCIITCIVTTIRIHALNSAPATIAAIEKEYKAASHDVRKQMAYAAVAPCSISVALYTEIAAGKNVPDSLRAAAYRQLGDFSFAHSAFKTAADWYGTASQLYSIDEYTYLQAKALAALGDNAALPLLRKLRSNIKNEYALQAGYSEALFYINLKQFDSAYAALAFIDSCSPDDPWFVGALAIKLECALLLNKKKETAFLQESLKSFGTDILEKDSSNHVFPDKRIGPNVATQVKTSSISPPVSPQGAVVDVDAAEREYTLQVGAFSSKENALALKEKLGKRYGNILIIPVSVAESKIYRVRLGNFKCKNDADTFGKDSLTVAGISFQAVVK